MTDSQGIAAVTRVVAYFAETAILPAVPDAKVTQLRPEQPPPGAGEEPRLNVYLVQIAPNATLRSQDMPTRGPDGELVSVPQAALDLRYLFSYFGPSEKAQLMLGALEVALHEQPVLSRALIERALAHEETLSSCGLQSQSPPVRLTPSTVSLEELSRFWSGFLQTPYTLSTLYLAGPVILSSALTPGAYGLVQDVGLLRTAMPPTLAALDPVAFAAGTPVAVAGRGVAAGQWAQVDGHWAQIEAQAGSAPAFALPAGVAAGVREVVLGELPPGGATPRPIPGSPSRTLVVRPALRKIVAEEEDRRITIALAPPVQPGQLVEVSLLAMSSPEGDPPPSATLPVVASSRSDTLTVPLPDGALPAGSYLALVAVDGVSSLPVVEGGRATRPTVLLG